MPNVAFSSDFASPIWLRNTISGFSLLFLSVKPNRALHQIALVFHTTPDKTMIHLSLTSSFAPILHQHLRYTAHEHYITLHSTFFYLPNLTKLHHIALLLFGFCITNLDFLSFPSTIWLTNASYHLHSAFPVCQT